MSFFFVLLLLLLLLSFSVCGSVLGLSFLVSLIPSHGSDYFNLLDSLW